MKIIREEIGFSRADRIKNQLKNELQKRLKKVIIPEAFNSIEITGDDISDLFIEIELNGNLYYFYTEPDHNTEDLNVFCEEVNGRYRLLSSIGLNERNDYDIKDVADSIIEDYFQDRGIIPAKPTKSEFDTWPAQWR